MGVEESPMKQSAVVALMLTACASDYKVIADADALAGTDDFFDTGITEEEEAEEAVPVDPDAPHRAPSLRSPRVRAQPRNPFGISWSAPSGTRGTR